MTSPEHRPRFSGTVRYEAEASLPDGCAGIDLGACSGAATLYLDDQEIAVRIAPPYVFRFAPCAGVHRLRIEVANAPVFAHRDALSFFACLKPTGIQGPVTLHKEVQI